MLWYWSTHTLYLSCVCNLSALIGTHSHDLVPREIWDSDCSLLFFERSQGFFTLPMATESRVQYPGFDKLVGIHYSKSQRITLCWAQAGIEPMTYAMVVLSVNHSTTKNIWSFCQPDYLNDTNLNSIWSNLHKSMCQLHALCYKGHYDLQVIVYIPTFIWTMYKLIPLGVVCGLVVHLPELYKNGSCMWAIYCEVKFGWTLVKILKWSILTVFSLIIL